MLYRHTLPDVRFGPGAADDRRQRTLSSSPPSASACAESIGTHQVLCYQRNLAIGEVVGIDTRPKDIGIAA